MKKEDYSDNNVDFQIYCERIFQIDEIYDSEQWIFAFSGSWEIADNTPTGAAKRIRYLVENPMLEMWHGEISEEAVDLYQ